MELVLDGSEANLAIGINLRHEKCHQLLKFCERMCAGKSVPVLCPVVTGRHPRMFAELFVEIGYSRKSAFKDNFIDLVVSLAEEIACLVCTHLVDIVNKSAAGAS